MQLEAHLQELEHGELGQRGKLQIFAVVRDVEPMELDAGRGGE